MFVPNILGMSYSSTGGLANGTTVTANRAHYIPFTPPYDTAVASMSVYCATASGNYDLGLYDSAGTRLGSLGSTAQSAAGIKTWTPATPISVAADTQYFAAFGASGGGFTAVAVSSTPMRFIFLLIQASAFALPSSWTAPTTPVTVNPNPPLIRITFSG